jgi:hypothetical protein
MVAADPCAELQELKRQYESALRVWGQYQFPLHNESLGTRALRSGHLQLKQRALEERNSAKERVLDHERICLLGAPRKASREPVGSRDAPLGVTVVRLERRIAPWP